MLHDLSGHLSTVNIRAKTQNGKEAGGKAVGGGGRGKGRGMGMVRVG